MRLTTMQRRDKGDTLIEVIFAVTIFALIAVSSISIMNRGIATAERAIEITLVRQQMDAQADALRYMHDAVLTSAPGPVAAWKNMISQKKQTVASQFGTSGGQCALPNGSSDRPFILNARKAEVSSPPTIEPPTGAAFPPYPQVVYNADSSINKAYGLWIEAVPDKQGKPGEPEFIDFHIRACWDGPGSTVPMTLGTIVRLYDPI